MVRQGTGALKIAAMYLERLKQLKVYDNSLIFIVGDHGSGIADALLDPSPLGAKFNTGGPYPGSFEKFKAMGVPLVLVKRIDARGRMKTSDAPVCLGDIPQTVVEELGLDARFPGKSMFGVKEDEERERIYRAFVGPQEDVEYLAPLYEYSVNGFSWDDASWKETGNVYYAKPKQPDEAIPRD
jgi:arylsulfatase A-like enzyme